MKLAFCPPACAICCSILSVIGIIFLVVLGALFKIEVHELTEGDKAPKDPQAVALGCFVAAGIYAAFLALSLCQTWLHKKQHRD
ncbi:hypothetical protein K493DRAFT_272744 [Basidiobolus meristosporus CBS 931.73]|uniref:Uncharacterized protein n=1 Tax=Basidiobolus meristosporus CBS 931.73 TaxID=1314790 RepID=A0A1Y1XY78_9FUNG|nr:hypothetical protein K493DRAFT_265459 [Basidiobolus meristosporus CBS 931.73]ORY08395.1 hypothetical protein K493DRAFT_272744 [Basidiobolus meristosporus CBS 931.73]|eukprot:ORX90703.1 hypothetical protein K493DRAFT_265459 [Basidiobolus meristosporus CBS 931.73]